LIQHRFFRFGDLFGSFFCGHVLHPFEAFYHFFSLTVTVVLSMHSDWYGGLIYRWTPSLPPDIELALASLQPTLTELRKWNGGALQSLIVYQDRDNPFTSETDASTSWQARPMSVPCGLRPQAITR